MPQGADTTRPGLVETVGIVDVRRIPRRASRLPTLLGLTRSGRTAVGSCLVDPSRGTLRQELNRDRLGCDAGVLVADDVHVVAARVDEALAGGVDMRRAARLVARVVGHRSGYDEDQARPRMRVPAGRPAVRRELVVDDVEVRGAVRLDPGEPDAVRMWPSVRPDCGRNALTAEIEVVDGRLRKDRGRWPALGVARTLPTYTGTPKATTSRPESISISSLLLLRRDRLDDPDGLELGALCHERRVPARRCVEDEEADLVLGNVDRAFEADARPLLGQLLGGGACPLLAGGALSRLAAGEVGLDEVAGHASTLGLGGRGGNVRTSEL